MFEDSTVGSRSMDLLAGGQSQTGSPLHRTIGRFRDLWVLIICPCRSISAVDLNSAGMTERSEGVYFGGNMGCEASGTLEIG